MIFSALVRAHAFVLLCLVLPGCAALGWGAQTAPSSDAIGAEVPTGPVAVEAQVIAPPALKALLEKHHDLIRLGALARGDAVTETEWARLVSATPAQVRALLATEGWLTPEVNVTRLPMQSGSATQRVRIDVKPGVRMLVGRVTLEFEGQLQMQANAGNAAALKLVAELGRAWALPTGTPFRNAAWSDAKTALLARVRALGYSTATWSGTGADLSPDTQLARIFLVMESGPLFRAGEIEIDGLVAQDAATVRHLAAFKTGAPLTEGMLLDYQERLQKSGLFDSVTVTHDTDPSNAEASRVQVRLREQTLQVYTFGLGYSANNGPRATVEHVDRRLFGAALRSRTFIELGRLKRSLNAELSTHPFDGLNRNVAGLALERLQTSTDVVLSERVRAGRARDTQEAERLLFVEGERSVRTTRLVRNDTLGVSANAHWVLRDLDSIVLPTQGYTLALQGGLGRSRGNNATSDFFGHSYARLTGYLPLGSAWYGQARIELGQDLRRNGVAIPDSQLFRAGGDDSVRGYAYRDLGPIVDGAVSGGASLFTTSLEVARPLSANLPSLWGVVFVDAGRAATSFRALTPALGYGLGVRWRSPVGPLRLDWAWANELHRGRFHFSIGIAL